MRPYNGADSPSALDDPRHGYGGPGLSPAVRRIAAAGVTPGTPYGVCARSRAGVSPNGLARGGVAIVQML